MKKDGIFYTIPFTNDDYAISKDAEIDGCTKLVAQLMLITFIGHHCGPVVYKDGNSLNCKKKNLTYGISNIIKLDNTQYAINNELFKLAYGYSYRLYLNEYGVLYDIQHGFISHGFSAREYHKFNIYDESGNRVIRMVHRFVYETWVKEISNDMQIDHLDGKHWNNHISNLEEVTNFENMQRSYDRTKVRTRRWSKSTIELICSMIENGYQITDILKNLNMNISERRKLSELIHNLIYKGYHRDITQRYDLSSYVPIDTKMGTRCLTEDDVIEIWNLSSKGMSDSKIAKLKGIANGTVYNITHGKSYKDITNKLH